MGESDKTKGYKIESFLCYTFFNRCCVLKYIKNDFISLIENNRAAVASLMVSNSYPFGLSNQIFGLLVHIVLFLEPGF